MKGGVSKERTEGRTGSIVAVECVAIDQKPGETIRMGGGRGKKIPW